MKLIYRLLGVMIITWALYGFGFEQLLELGKYIVGLALMVGAAYGLATLTSSPRKEDRE